MRPLGAPGFFSLQADLRGPGRDHAKGLPNRTLFLGMFRRNPENPPGLLALIRHAERDYLSLLLPGCPDTRGLA